MLSNFHQAVSEVGMVGSSGGGREMKRGQGLSRSLEWWEAARDGMVACGLGDGLARGVAEINGRASERLSRCIPHSSPSLYALLRSSVKDFKLGSL